jgi:hypothetical protein
MEDIRIQDMAQQVTARIENTRDGHADETYCLR